MKGNTRRPTILQSQHRQYDCASGERMREGAPSVILFHAKYNTPTAAVSARVLKKLPSTLLFEA